MKTHLIIIHHNERTLNQCIREAEKQAIVHLVSKTPFAKSLRVTFEMMIENKWQWAALIAADQILRPGAIKILEKTTETVKDNCFRISGYGYDYLLKRDRMLSPCMYRVKYLNEALKIDFRSELQPESFVLKEMRNKGYLSEIISDNLSVHDRGQYYRDIYNKGKHEAEKFIKYIIKQGIFSDLIQAKTNDHKVFLLGIFDYITQTERTSQEALESLGLKEKR